MATNSEAGRRAAIAADALAEYDHLPLVGIHAHANGRVHLTPEAANTTGRIAAVGRWAEAFGVVVALDATIGAAVTAEVRLGGRVEAGLCVDVNGQEFHELVVRLGVAWDGRYGRVEVSAEQLLAALHVEPGPADRDLAAAVSLPVRDSGTHGDRYQVAKGTSGLGGWIVWDWSQQTYVSDEGDVVLRLSTLAEAEHVAEQMNRADTSRASAPPPNPQSTPEDR